LPVNDRNTDRYYNRARKPSLPDTPVKNRGFVNMSGDSSDNDSRADGMSPSALKTPPQLRPQKTKEDALGDMCPGD
jgi:hypothetical protein